MIAVRLLQDTSGAPAVIDGALSLTREDLAARALALAAWLRRYAGVQEGAILAAALPNLWQYPVCFLAANALGAPLLAVNPQWRRGEAAWLVRKLGVRMAFVTRKTAPCWEGLLPTAHAVDVESGAFAEAIRQPPLRDLAPPDPSRTALLLTTSGSTGWPKIVPRSNANLIAGAQAVGEALGAGPGRRYLAVVPFHHANGFANCLLLPLLTGGVCVTARHALPAALSACIRRERVESLNLSPFLYSLLASHGPATEDLASVKIFLSSGAPLPAGLADLWRERFGRPIRQLYGSTEAGTVAIQDEDPGSTPGSVGRPLRPVEVRILSMEGDALPAGETGEVAVRGPAMMCGYVGEPALNQQAFRDGFFRMGDLGRLSQGGELILEGRLKRWVNAGGVKIDPVEVENVLRALPAVAACFVTGGRDVRGLDTLTALIQLKPGHAAERREIIAHCRRSLAEYKIPRVIKFVETLTVEPTGIIRKDWTPA